MSTLAMEPALYSRGTLLNNRPENMGGMADATERLGDFSALRGLMETHGHLLLRGFHDRQDVMAARADLVDVLVQEKQLLPGTDPMDAIYNPNAGPCSGADLDNRRPNLQRLIYGPRMMRFFDAFFDEPARHFDFTWSRAVRPGNGTPSHCDVVYMGRGSHELYTVWTPMGDVSYDLGGLIVLENSHHNERLRNTYGKMDVDAHCVNKTGRKGQDAWAKTSGWLGGNPLQIGRSLGGRWLTTEFQAGDIVIFSVFLVHGSLDNRSADRIRLSTDSRYQPASQPADERWIGENPPGHGPRGKLGKVC